MTQQDAQVGQGGGQGERKLIAISSGKGGVGKSTVTANIAVAMARMGLRVGVVDADIYGPSIPGMLGIAGNQKPAMSPDQKVIPAEAFGIKVMSMAMLSDDDSPAILRGPMVTKYLQMFVAQVEWGELDVLLLDLPPGTGDIQLTLAQAFPLTGAVVVSTPQDVSLKIARRGLRMMQQVNVPILGIVENMSGFACASCGEVTHIFSKGGGEAIASELGVPFLGAIPIEPEIVDAGDAGIPLVSAHPDSLAAQAYVRIAEALVGRGAAHGGLALPFDWQLSDGTGKPADAAPMSGGAADVVTALDHDEIGLMIRWQDGHAQLIGSRDLRLNCRCAACRDEMSGAPILDPSRVPQTITPTRIWSLGNYALGMAFSDGHSSGIYTFKALRDMQSAEVEDV
ncbi:Septum site-determining protein MinD [Roseovarius tolerans]|uniref:Iron-sulfur cluster carrier protein n=1 Tax=Roseovarius tolerans TaxID=74031 RepID=A0A0L6CSK2_9RHOB|nr:P-loop NTPase [Roseovarius tolerans]KNX40754.1 Septum site-determining protein MinD [Roseovarius tolerans]